MDGQKEVQRVITWHNQRGWRVVHYASGGSSKFTLMRFLFTNLIQVLTLGILSYWTGFAIIFEKDLNTVSIESSEQNTGLKSITTEAISSMSINEVYGSSLNK